MFCQQGGVLPVLAECPEVVWCMTASYNGDYARPGKQEAGDAGSSPAAVTKKTGLEDVL